MKIYIAGYFDTRARLREQKEKLWKMGHEIVSSWLDETAKNPSMSHDDFYRKLGFKDLAEVHSADLLIVDTIDVTPRGGREVELGYAIGQHQTKLIYIVGPKRNVFHTLVDKHFDNWDECIEYIKTTHHGDTRSINEVTGAATLADAAAAS